MYDHGTQGKPLLSVLLVLLLLLPFTSCSSTQQEDNLALMYSPTYKKLETAPLTLPTEVAGKTCEYELLGVEDFSAVIHAPTRGFLVGEIGTFPKEDEEPWVLGKSDGSQKYMQYYRTDPNIIPLNPGGWYEVSYRYKVLETPDEGFETILFSNTGAQQNNWVEQSIFITEPAGTEGVATMQAQLKQYSDYQLLMNVVSKGAIAVTEITIKDMATNAVVAYEDCKKYQHTHSLMLRGDGDFTIGKSTIPTGNASIVTTGWLKLWTNSSVVKLPKDTVILLEFDYKVLKNPKNLDQLGWVRIYSGTNTKLDRGAMAIPAYQVTEGHYTGAVKTGTEDDIYILEANFSGDVSVELTNFRVSRQITVPQSIEDSPAQKLKDAPYPRLGNFFTSMAEWVARDGSGSAQGDTPWMSFDELERRLALSDVVVGMHAMYSTNDPAASLRLRALNPNIVLLPAFETHVTSRDGSLPQPQLHQLSNAEQAFIAGMSKSWYLTNAKGETINAQDGWSSIPMNVSAFCPYNEKGERYLDYWARSAVDLHLADGSWDGIMLNDLLTRGSNLIPGISTKRKVDADYNLNKVKDETPLWITEMSTAASLTMLRSLREKVGNDELLISHQYLDSVIAPLVNGAFLISFNWSWYEQQDPEKFLETQWSGFLSDYQQMRKLYRDPSFMVLQGTAQFPEEVPENKREADEVDIELNRLAFATALLTDGFYEYDLVDGRSAPIFFDEMLVDKQGISTDSIEGKGYLGMPLGEAEHLVTNQTEVFSLAKPVVLGDKGTKSKKIATVRNKDGESKQFLLEFDWRNLSTHTSQASIGLSSNNMWKGYYLMPSQVEGASGHASIFITVEKNKDLITTLYVGRKGALEFSNLKIHQADAGVFRRDFEHGIVLVNATNEEKTISLSDIKGRLGRTNLRRIKGQLDPATNNGRPVSEAVTLKAHDALILLAD